MTNFKVLALSLLTLGLGAGQGYAHAKSVLEHDSIWKCDKNKRNWYCDEQEEREVVKTPIAISQLQQHQKKEEQRTIKDLKQIKTAEELREELKFREDIAVMNPTPQNVKNYLDAWHLVQDKATVFTDQWRRVVWTKPEYDYSQKMPNNSTAIRVNNQVRSDS